MGVLLGCGLALTAGTVLAMASHAPPPSGGASKSARVLRVYPAGRDVGAHGSIDPASRVRFLPGVVGGGSRVDGLEAILRLHAYLALRDVDAGAVELDWRPARPWGEGDAAIAAACTPTDQLVDDGDDPAAEGAGPFLLRSGARPDPLGRELEPDRDFRVLLRADQRPGEFRVEAWACTAQGAERSEVFVGQASREGVVLRELSTWLAATVGVRDPGDFEDHWGRDPAPRGPALSTYGDLLARSLDREGSNPRLGPREPQETLDDASRIVPEAAWLVAALAEDRTERIIALRRAAALRVGFTAALEDLAAVHLELGQTDLAAGTLGRLSDDEARRRPTELLLAAELIADGRPAEARAILAELPGSWRQTDAAARLHAVALLALDQPVDAERAASAWVASDPDSAEALVLRGRALAAAGRLSEAEGDWRRACRLDAEWRTDALSEWTRSTVDAGRPAEVVEFIDDLASEDGVELPDTILEYRGYAALRAGDPVSAARDYAELAERNAEAPSIAVGWCVASMLSGQAGANDEPCQGVPANELAGLQLALASASRRLGRWPGYPVDTSEGVIAAMELAPLDPRVAEAELYVLASNEHASAELQQQALARWRVAVGARVPAPKLPEPQEEP